MEIRLMNLIESYCMSSNRLAILGGGNEEKLQCDYIKTFWDVIYPFSDT